VATTSATGPGGCENTCCKCFCCCCYKCKLLQWGTTKTFGDRLNAVGGATSKVVVETCLCGVRCSKQCLKCVFWPLLKPISVFYGGWCVGHKGYQWWMQGEAATDKVFDEWGSYGTEIFPFHISLTSGPISKAFLPVQTTLDGIFFPLEAIAEIPGLEAIEDHATAPDVAQEVTDAINSGLDADNQLPWNILEMVTTLDVGEATMWATIVGMYLGLCTYCCIAFACRDVADCLCPVVGRWCCG